MTVFFTPYYGDIILNLARKLNLTESSVIGHKLSLRCLNYLQEHRLPVDLKGRSNDYDLVVTCSDLIIPSNIRKRKLFWCRKG